MAESSVPGAVCECGDTKPDHRINGHGPCRLCGCLAFSSVPGAVGERPNAGQVAAEWHRYLHNEGILVEDEGEECGPWHHRVFLGGAVGEREEHPERFCGRCGGPNLMCWHAPSPLWNFRISSDPPCEEEARIAVLRSLLARLSVNEGGPVARTEAEPHE